MRCAKCLSVIDDETSFCPHCGHQVADNPSVESYAYEAFISYRHLPRDRRAARRIQRALEGMRIPKEAQLEGGATRLGKLFRDEDELPTSDSLTDQIRDALKHSRYLIVIASPEMRESMWVQREVELFSSFHGRDHVVVALVAGEPSESFPELLLTRLDVDRGGKVSEVPCEPIAADLREGTGKRFGVEVLRIAARLIGCGFDDLRQRQRARHTRLVAAVASGVAAVSLAFGSFALYQRAQIAAALKQTQIRESEALAEESSQLLAQGDRIQAIEVALAALPDSSTATDRPLVPAAQLALETALGLYPTFEAWHPVFSVGSTTRYTFTTSEDGLFATRLTDGRFLVGSLADGREVCTFDPVGELSTLDDLQSDYAVEALFEGEQLLVRKAGAVGLFDPADGSCLWSTAFEGLDSFGCMRVSPDATQIALAELSSDYSSELGAFVYQLNCCLIDAATGATLREMSLALPGDLSLVSKVQLAFSVDGTELALTAGNQVFLIDLTTGQARQGSVAQEHVLNVGFADDRLMCISGNNADTVLCTEPFELTLLDEQLQPLWSRFEDPRTTWDAHGNWEDNIDACFLGTHSYEDYEGEQALFAIGCDLFMLRLEDGAESYRQRRDAPILASRLSSESDNLYLIDADGSLIFRAPRIDGNDTGTGWDTNVGTIYDARFGVYGEGEGYVAFWDYGSSRWHVMRYGARSSGSQTGKELEALEDARSWAWSDELIVCVTSQNLIALSSENFETLWRVPLASLVEEGATVNMECVDDAVCVFGSSYSTLRTVFFLSPSDGSIIDQLELDEEVWRYAPEDLEEAILDGYPALIVLDYDKVQLIDRASGEARLTCEAAPSEYFRSGQIVNNDLLVFASGDDSKGRFHVFDVESGEERACALASCVTSSSTGFPPFASLSQERGRLAIACADGYLRCYDTTGWNLLWERDDVAPSIQFLRYVEDDTRLVIQDESGILMLLDGADGTPLAASGTKLASITMCRVDAHDPSILHAIWRYKGMNFDVGVATISTKDDGFGTLSNVTLGMLCSGDGTTILGYDSIWGRTVLYPRYTLDELIALGRAEVEGRELTEAERHIYRIE